LDATENRLTAQLVTESLVLDYVEPSKIGEDLMLKSVDRKVDRHFQLIYFNSNDSSLEPILWAAFPAVRFICHSDLN
jgi:hypothetical protein